MEKTSTLDAAAAASATPFTPAPTPSATACMSRALRKAPTVSSSTVAGIGLRGSSGGGAARPDRR